jgi:uncharacterized delta-60 repeat protein
MKAFLLTVFVALASIAQAAPGDIDRAFNGGMRFNGAVASAALQPDGKLVIGGAFTTLGGGWANRVARLNTDGTLDRTFEVGKGPDANVTIVLRQDDGKFLVAGHFTNFNGFERRGVVRLEANGAVDASFVPAVTNGIRAMVLQPGGKVIVAGFLSANGNYDSPHYAMVRLTESGARDPQFVTQEYTQGIGATALAALPDGKFLAAQYCAKANQPAETGIFRFNADGTRDNDFHNAGVSSVYAMAPLPDGRVMIGGRFDFVDTLVRPNLACLLASGHPDTSFPRGPGNQVAEGEVNAITIEADGGILIGGNFTKVFNVPRLGLARLKPDFSLDASEFRFTLPDMYRYEGSATCIIAAGESIFAGGTFKCFHGSVNFQDATSILKWSKDGALDRRFSAISGASAQIQGAAFQPDGKIIVTGMFTEIDGVQRFGIARLHTGGSLDRSFDAPYRADFSEPIVLADGKILIGASHNNVTGNGTVLRLNTNGTIDGSFQTRLVGAEFATSLAPRLARQADGKILASGVFFYHGGVTRLPVIRLNADGSQDQTFLTATNSYEGSALDIAPLPDGKVLLAGTFRYYNLSKPNQAILRLNADGSLDEQFQANGSTDGVAVQAELLSDGKYLVAGHWRTFEGGIRKFHPNGNRDTTFQIRGVQDSMFTAFAVRPNGKILVSGYFVIDSEPQAYRVAQFNADGSFDSTFAVQTTVQPELVRLQPDGKAIIAGSFRAIDQDAIHFIARLKGDSVLAATWSANSLKLEWSELEMNLQAAPEAQGAYTNVTASSPYAVPAIAGRQFFRLQGD